jgi:hypothetical protein
MSRWDFGGFLRHYLGAIEQVARQDTIVDHHNGDLRLAVIQHQTPRMEFVMDFRCPAIGESARHGDPQPGSDIAGGGTSPKDFVCCEGLQDEYEDQEKWNSHAKG